MKTVRIIALLAAASVVLMLVLLWIPGRPRFPAHPQPAQDYAQAMSRVEQLQAKDSDELFPECHSVLLSHGEQMTHTIVFFHGISNCPAQFAVLGQQFYEMGYNVLIPRMPHHGWADRMTDDLANLTAEELVASADEAVDIAAGLGDQVTVVGFSTGGTIAAWLAMQRPEVDQTVLLSPFLSPKAYPAWIIRPLARVLLLMPNQFWWWNNEFKEQLPGPRYAYARYPSHAMAEIMLLSLAVRDDAQQKPPQSANILVVTNGSAVETVDNNIADRLMAAWQQEGQAKVTSYEFESSMALEHDYIDPGATNQPVNVVETIYPVLVEQIHGAEGTTQ